MLRDTTYTIEECSTMNPAEVVALLIEQYEGGLGSRTPISKASGAIRTPEYRGFLREVQEEAIVGCDKCHALTTVEVGSDGQYVLGVRSKKQGRRLVHAECGGTLGVAAAPGGSRINRTSRSDVVDVEPRRTNEFVCTSCHLIYPKHLRLLSGRCVDCGDTTIRVHALPSWSIGSIQAAA
jgi:ribosomal protein L37AE/L43A